MSRSDGLVAYTYRADLYCRRCILRELIGRDPVGIGDSPFVFTVDRVEAALDRGPAAPYRPHGRPAVRLRRVPRRRAPE